MNNNMKLLSCIIYKDYFYFIGYWLGEIIRSLLEIFLEILPNKKNNRNNKNSNKEESYIIEEELLKLILLNIADLLTGFLVLYTKKKMRSSDPEINLKKKSKSKTIGTPLLYTDLPRFKHKIFIIPLISILDLIASSVYLIAALFSKINFKPKQLDWMMSIDIIARIFFSIIILKITVRKHHKFGIILCIIGFVLMSVSDIISIENSRKKAGMEVYDIIISILIIFPHSILFPLVDVLYKIVLTNDYLLPHSLMFYRGVSQTIIYIIIPILNWKKKINWKFLQKFNIYKIIYSFSFTIISCIRNLSVLKVIYIFNSHYVSFLHAIIIFENTFRQFLDHDKTYDMYRFGDFKGVMYFASDIIALIVISVGTLIFNEMIIINACGLNKKVRANLLIEEKDDDKICESFYYEEEEEEDEIKSEKKDKSFGISSNSNNESNDSI